MNKYSLPAIMTATVMFAAIFAFMPVDNAQAVHTTVQGTQMTQAINEYVDDITAGTDVTCDSDASFIMYVVTEGASANGDTLTIVETGAATVLITADVFLSTEAGAAGWGADGFSGAMAGEAAEQFVVDGSGTGYSIIVSMITTSGATAGCPVA